MAKALFAFIVKQSSAAYKAVIAVVKQHFFFRRKPAVVQMYGFHAFKQAFVQSYVVGVFRQYRLHFLCQRVHLVIRLGTKQIEKYGRHARQQVIISVLVVVNVDYCIVESRFVLIVYCLFYLFVVTPYAFHKGFFKVFKPDVFEGNSVVRGIVRFKKRILTLAFCLISIHTDVHICF